MKDDTHLLEDVLNELAKDPPIDAPHLGIMVKDGKVMLTGLLSTDADKRAVSKAVQRLTGCLGIAVAVNIGPVEKRSERTYLSTSLFLGRVTHR